MENHVYEGLLVKEGYYVYRDLVMDNENRSRMNMDWIMYEWEVGLIWIGLGMRDVHGIVLKFCFKFLFYLIYVRNEILYWYKSDELCIVMIGKLICVDIVS